MFRRIKKSIYIFQVCCLGAVLGFSSAGFAQENFHAGPAFDQFSLTLDSGCRTEAVGPFFYDQQTDSEKTRAIPPLLSYDADPATESKEFDLLYPLLTYESYGNEYRWQFFQLLAFSGGENPQDSSEKRFTIFPLYFQQRSPDTNENYTALVPFYGHLKNRLFRDDIYFVMFPIYSETRKKDVVTDNYLYPFFHFRHGDGLRGWQFWPLVGEEHKVVTTTTNGFGDVAIVGGHDKFFALWPFYFKNDVGIGTDDPEKSCGVLPFYAQTRSPLRDSTSALWPFFTWIDERGKKYHEWQGPWPFVIFTRGEGKTTSRVWPLFSQSHNNEMESDSYFWPLYQFHRLHADPLDQRRTRVLFYLYEDTVEKNTETGAEKRRVDMWPFFTWHRDFNGNSRLQILALIEPVLPGNRGVERNWSPLWSLWRSENNPKTGAGSRSLLWNLYRRDTTPASKKCSLLFGLFQYQSKPEGKTVRVFYIPVVKTKSTTNK
ncbi:MAG TPA: hypothetical protein VGH42_14710 [Verrucomicrobiae bacterium]